MRCDFIRSLTDSSPAHSTRSCKYSRGSLRPNDTVCLPCNECAVEGKVAVDLRVRQQGVRENVVILSFLIAFEGRRLVVGKI